MSLQQYDVIRELGRGGMALVHLARQRDLSRLVALKELAGLSSDDPAMAERFLRESRVASSLNHANIVTVYEYFKEGGTPFIAMELVEGGSLRPLIGELSTLQAVRVIEDVLKALSTAGRANIVHRDIKPENVLLTKDGNIKVADFGIAKAAQSGVQGLTTEGMTVGTPEYMSPEQALARDVGPQSDLYAVGCMAYEMITGRLPFTDGQPAALLMRHVNDPVPDVREVDPMIPQAVAEWVERMTQKAADDRFDNAEEAWQALEDAVVEFSGPLWRRQAEIDPAALVDLSDIPPQGPTPIPLKTGPNSMRTGAVTGYQTYHAPQALHEQLGTDDGTAISTPTPAARAPRRSTPPPMPTPAPAGPKRTTATPAITEPDESGPRAPVAAMVLAGIVAAVVAFLIASSGGGEELPTASGDGFQIKAPAGWTKAAANLVPAVGDQGIAMAAPNAPQEGVAAAVISDEATARLLRDGEQVSRVKLDAGQAALVDRPDGDVYLLPTDRGILAIGCTAGAAAAAECPRLAASVGLSGRKAVDPGPTEDGARRLSVAISRLEDAIRVPSEELRTAGSRGGQAAAARDLSRSYRDAASTVGDTDLGALAERARDQLAQALDAVGAGWGTYATAARAGDASRVASARTAVSTARARVPRARNALKLAGYTRAGD